MNALKTTIEKGWMEKLIFCSVILSAICAPITGQLNKYFPYASRLFLFTALLLILVGGLYMILHKDILNAIKTNKYYFILGAVVLVIVTFKYIQEIFSGKTVTFFTAYAVPAYIVYSFILFYILTKIPGTLNWLLTAYCSSFCLLFLLFQNYYVEANNVFRAVAMYKGSTELGLYALLSTFCAFILLVRNKNYRIINYLFFGISAAAVFLSGSRGSLLATAIGLLLYGLFSIRHIMHSKKYHLLCSVLAIVLSTGVCIGVFLPSESDKRNSTRYDKLGFDYYEPEDEDDVVSPPKENDEVEGLISGNKHQDFSSLIDRLFFGDSDASSYTNNLRLQIWAEYIKVIIKNPLTGISFDLSQRPYLRDKSWDSHNTFLYIGSRYGVAVLAIYVSWVIVLCLTAIFKKNKTPFYIATFSMFGAILVNSCVQDLVNTSTIWIAIAITLFAQYALQCINTNNEEKKILIVRNYTGDGGIERQITNISAGLIENGYKVYAFTDVSSSFSERLNQVGVTVIVSNSKNMFIKGIEIYRICRQHRIRLIQSHMWKESFYARFACFIDRSLLHVYRVHTYIDCSQITENKKRVYHVLDKLTSFWVDRYVSINTFNVKELQDRTHIGKGKVIVVHNGVLPLGKPDDHTKKPINRTAIGMVANLVENKGHDVLIDGIYLLKKRGYILNAYIIGGVPGEGTAAEDLSVKKAMEEKVHALHLDEHIVFSGHSANIAMSISDFTFIVLPSYAEGTPNCLLEAMSEKKLVIASAVGGIPEFIQDGVNGFLHKPGSTEDFADKLEEVLSKDDNTLISICEAGYQTWLNGYTVDHMINGLTKIYSELCEAGKEIVHESRKTSAHSSGI